MRIRQIPLVGLAANERLHITILVLQLDHVVEARVVFPPLFKLFDSDRAPRVLADDLKCRKLSQSNDAPALVLDWNALDVL